MSGRPARIRQYEIRQIVRGATKAGAKAVTVRIGDVRVDIKLDEAPTAPVVDEWGINDTHQA
jgi:hypothetical protein